MRPDIISGSLLIVTDKEYEDIMRRAVNHKEFYENYLEKLVEERGEEWQR